MSVCQRQQGKELFGFVQKLTELKLWSKVRSNPDLYVVCQHEFPIFSLSLSLSLF